MAFGDSNTSQSLYTVPEEKIYIIESVPNATLLSALGVFPESKVRKEYTYSFGGPVLVTVGDRRVSIGKKLAMKIQVREVADVR